MKPERIVSGGQTGVDRAALDAAQLLNIACGGWCPRGRRAEDGVIPERYPLRETPEEACAQRTEWNVRDSDGTLIICPGKPAGGAAFTIETARHMGRPLLIMDPGLGSDTKDFSGWLDGQSIRILNVAGPRESQSPGIYRLALELLLGLFKDTLKNSEHIRGP